MGLQAIMFATFSSLQEIGDPAHTMPKVVSTEGSSQSSQHDYSYLRRGKGWGAHRPPALRRVKLSTIPVWHYLCSVLDHMTYFILKRI